jgi:hypothetical protein
MNTEADKDAEFYFRLLLQCVLTYGANGVLEMDSSKGEEAISLIGNEVVFGNGRITVSKYGEKKHVDI